MFHASIRSPSGSTHLIESPPRATMFEATLILGTITLWSLMVVFLLLALGFALLNVATEEATYRGVIMHALKGALGPGAAALVL